MATSSTLPIDGALGPAAPTVRPATLGGQIETLSAARGVAALLVLFFHLRESLPWAGQHALAVLDKGYLAVDFFFLLSGFVLWLRYGAGNRIHDGPSARAFLIDRLLRLYPLHLAVLAAMAVFACLVALGGGETAARYPFAQLPAHLLLIQAWGFSPALVWNDPAWSISAEWGANLLFCAFCLWPAGRRWLGAHPVAASTLLLLALPLWFAARGEATLGEDIDGSGLVRCVGAFGAGLGIAGAWLAGRDRAFLAAMAGTVLVGGVGALVGALPAEPALAPPALAAAVMLLARGDAMPTVRAMARPFVPLGRISYSVYLTQFLGWTVFKLLFVTDPRAVHPLLIALFIACVLATSTLTYRFIEQGLRLRLRDRLLPRRPS